MKNSGLVSVGHILIGNYSSDVKTLRHLYTVLLCNLDEEMVHKTSGFYLFDKFMSTSKATVENFSTLILGILRKQETEELWFQLKVRLVNKW